jgi:CheY-like chemotaxis protein
VKASSYDLYFIDLNMPRKSGLQLAQEIRGGEVEGVEQDAYLLAYTASATTKVRERCRTVGFNDYLSKPVTREHIRIALEKAEKARG